MPPISVLSSLLLVPVLVFGGMAGALGAQSPAQSTKPKARRSTVGTYEERTRVFEVQVPVNVTDRHGVPVRGLVSDDFVVLDRGKPQQLTGFHVVDLAQVHTSAERVMQPEVAIPAAARRHFLLLFDLSFSAPTALVRARRAAGDFVLRQMHDTDLAAVAVHSVESGTQLLVTFTPDRAQLARAINHLANPRLMHLATRDPLRFILDVPDSASALVSRDVGGVSEEVRGLETSLAGHLRTIGNQMAKVERSYARGQVASWAKGMGEMARILASVEGRKHVLLFSEGFDGRLLLGRQPDAQDEQMHEEIRNIENGDYFLVDTDERYGNTQLQTNLAVVLTEFRRANCVIHAVDISGLRADQPEENRVKSVGQDALFYIANETGGQLYDDANDFGRDLLRVLESSTVTYLLSFRPSELGAPGEHRELKVKLASEVKGTDISHRMGYYVPRDFDDLHPLEKNLLASDLIAAASVKEDIDLELLVAPFRASDVEAYVPVIVEIDGKSLLAAHEGRRLPVELYAYATDERGEMKDFFTQLVTLDLQQRRDALESSGLKYYGHLTLGAGDHLIRVLVRNASTGTTGLTTARVHIPEFGAGRLALLPPFFLESPGRWFLVRETEGQPLRDSTVYPFTVNGEPYVPSAAPDLAAGKIADVCLVAYNLGKGEVGLDSRLRGADGEEIAGSRLVLRERTVTGIDGLDKLVVTFDPVGLEAGRYTLVVGVTDPLTRARSESSIPLRVLN